MSHQFTQDWWLVDHLNLGDTWLVNQAIQQQLHHDWYSIPFPSPHCLGFGCGASCVMGPTLSGNGDPAAGGSQKPTAQLWIGIYLNWWMMGMAIVMFNGFQWISLMETMLMGMLMSCFHPWYHWYILMILDERALSCWLMMFKGRCWWGSVGSTAWHCVAAPVSQTLKIDISKRHDH